MTFADYGSSNAIQAIELTINNPLDNKLNIPLRIHIFPGKKTLKTNTIVIIDINARTMAIIISRQVSITEKYSATRLALIMFRIIEEISIKHPANSFS